MGANVSEVIGVVASIVVLAAIAVLVVNGTGTAKVIGAGGKAFNDSLRTATRGGK
jgi:hypothetical protein